ncbi:MAG: hypothetical protein HC896_11835 [Bacteroidales bacterium]|nr:hypothetical protein [Bacteroidales bacterium]
MALTSRKIGDIYLEMNHLIDAMPHIQASIKIGSSINNFTLLEKAWYSKYSYHVKNNQLSKAMESLQQHYAYRDSAVTMQTNSTLLCWALTRRLRHGNWK